MPDREPRGLLSAPGHELMPDSMAENGQIECQTECENICQMECQIESQNIHVYCIAMVFLS